MKKALVAVAAAGLFASGAYAHKIIAPGLQDKIAKGSFAATSGTEWNKLQQNGGKYQEIWTIDGDDLNKVTFFGGVPVGEPLFREFDKKDNPLPKVTANMLITDIPTLLESTYRTQFHTTRMQIARQDATTIDGNQAINFTYSFVKSEDEVERKGEAYGAFVDGKIYLVTYEAPALYFYDRSVDEFRTIATSLKIRK
jgi:hypothetical protein